MAEPAFIRQSYDGDPYALPTQDHGPIRVKFFKEAILDAAQTEIAGKAVYREQEYLEYGIPGDLKSRPVLKVTDRHRQKHRKEYEAFKAGMELEEDGTPLDKAGFLSKGHVMTLQAQGFRTVEEFAETDDGTIGRLGMDYRKRRDQARAYVAALGGSLQAEKISALEKQLADLTALLTKATEPGTEAVPIPDQAEFKRGPGRPRKEVAHETSEGV